MPRSPEQFEEIRKEKKKLIMDIALELFAKKGFHATSISQITKQAGISKGLVYNYFSSKQEILKEIIEAAFTDIYKNFDQNNDGELSHDEFIFFIRKIFGLVRENTTFWQLYFSLMVQPDIHKSFTKEYEEKAKPVMMLLYNFLKGNGSQDPEGDLMVISALIEGTFLYSIVAPEFFPLDVMEEKVINACFRFISQ